MRIISVFLLIALLVGCQLSFADADPESIEIGWTMSQVTAAWDGTFPDAMTTTDTGLTVYELWSYIGEWSAWTFQFKDGIVVSISKWYY